MSTAIDGQAEALRLLRTLRTMNSSRERPVKSAHIVGEQLRLVSSWSCGERQRFMRVLSDWLVAGALGFNYNLDEYEDVLKYGKAAMRAQHERAHQEYMAKLAGKPGSTTH